MNLMIYLETINMTQVYADNMGVLRSFQLSACLTQLSPPCHTVAGTSPGTLLRGGSSPVGYGAYLSTRQHMSLQALRLCKSICHSILITATYVSLTIDPGWCAEWMMFILIQYKRLRSSNSSAGSLTVMFRRYCRLYFRDLILCLSHRHIPISISW